MEITKRWFDSEQFAKEAKNWLSAIDLMQNIAVIFFPKTDRPRRLDQFLNDPKIINTKLKHKTVFIPLSFSTIESAEELKDAIEKNLNSSILSQKSQDFQSWINFLEKKSIHLVLIIPEAETLFSPAGTTVLIRISELIRKYPNVITSMSLYEINIAHPNIISHLPSATNIFEKIFHYPLYEPADVLNLIKLREERWKISIPNKIKNEMVESCGGHLWLITETLNQFVETGNWSSDSPNMAFRLEAIAKQLSEDEINILTRLESGERRVFNNDESNALEYLTKMRVLGPSLQIKIPILSSYLMRQKYINRDLTLQGYQIMLNRVPINDIFSRKEIRVVRLFLEQEGKIVDRDMIAQAIWPAKTQENYSDWAIDQTISRIRRHFRALALPPAILRSVRSHGYILKRN